VTGNQKIDQPIRSRRCPMTKLPSSTFRLRRQMSWRPRRLEADPAAFRSTGPARLRSVADRNEGAVSIFAINRKTLTPAGRLQLGDAKSGPSDVTFTPDGRMALVTRDGDHKISILAIDGEGIAMAPDGRFVALTVTNYSDKAVSFPFFSPHGFLKINKLNGTQLDPVAQIEDGHWCQGASWRRGSREILVQHMVEREIQVFDFDGHHIKVDGGARRRWHGRALMDGWTFSRRRRMQWHD
jgi:hypothetical protein